MHDFAERAGHVLCLGVGRLLRAGRYSVVQVVVVDGERQVRKRRLPYAPMLVAMGGPLVRLLDTGVRVLPATEWIERERRLYRDLYGSAVNVDGDVVILPYIAGRTLAAALEDRGLEVSQRKRAIEGAVAALAEFHRHGFTHGDAMAENVMIDLVTGSARWFDFETVHDADRPIAWRRADDVRALLATCLLRTPAPDLAPTLHLILDAYADDVVASALAANFTALRRPLPFHLGQAPLSYPSFREIGRLLRERTAECRRGDVVMNVRGSLALQPGASPGSGTGRPKRER